VKNRHEEGIQEVGHIGLDKGQDLEFASHRAMIPTHWTSCVMYTSPGELKHCGVYIFCQFVMAGKGLVFERGKRRFFLLEARLFLFFGLNKSDVVS
jgi:hypothetical protein